MGARDFSKDGWRNILEGLFLTRFTWFWNLIDRNGFLRTRFNKFLINLSISKIPSRPNKLSTMADYPSWESLTDRTFSDRHLPPIATNNLPPVKDVAELFRRPPGPLQKFGKSTVLFSYFAQWFTDGFLRTDYFNPLKNTSNHDIDLSNLYGPNWNATQALRAGAAGKLKSQFYRGEEYPPFFYQDGQVPKAFEVLSMAWLLPVLEKMGNAPDGPSDDPMSRPHLFSGFKSVLKRKPLDPLLFAMGGDRINSVPGFTAMNVLFLREHNRICDVLHQNNAGWDDERLFQTARNILIVTLLKIVINEYINHITPYQFKFGFAAGAFEDQRWYRQNWMAVEFNLLYRWHSLVPNSYVLDGKELPLIDTLFNNALVVERGIGPFLQDAARQGGGRIGLFNTPDALLPIEEGSIALGRKASLAGYNEYRELCKFPKVTSFAQITSDENAQTRLKDLYGSVDRIEYYPGIFAEDVMGPAAVPWLIGRLVSVDAFSQALTNPLLSANLYNKATFSDAGLEIIDATKSLADILNRNVPKGQGPFELTFDRDQSGTPAAPSSAGTAHP